MLRADVEKVYIEHCVSCKNHHWCTNHDEDKYKEYYSRCQAAISRGCFNVTVVENQVPDGYTNQFITDPNISKPGKFHFPRIGSFEVYFRGVCVFSKINSQKWPKASKIAEKIREIQETPQAETRKKSKVKRVKSAYPGKKRKVRKTKKKTGKRKDATGAKEGLNKYVVERKKEGNVVNYAELFKDPHSRSSSSSDRKNSDSEQPVPPYEYYRAQPKAKTPPKQLDSFGNAEYQKQPSPPKSQENKPEVQNPVRQVKKVEKYSSSSSSSSSKYKHKSESPDYSSESYESNPLIEKIDLSSHLKRTEELPKIDKSSSSAEYHSSDYEQYQSSSKSSKKSEKSEKFKKPEKPEKKSSDSDEYKEDYEQSSSSSSDHKQPAKKFSNSSSSSNKPAPKKDKKKSSSSDSSTPKRLNKSSSSDTENEDYDQDFEDQEEEVHPLRKVDKSYPVTLPIGEEVRKKITYENMSNENTEFTIKTSHPDYMSVKEEHLVIEKNHKEKIQLRFAPIFTENEKKYYIYIDKGSVPWECIEIVAQYE